MCIPAGDGRLVGSLITKLQAQIARHELKRRTEDFDQVSAILGELFHYQGYSDEDMPARFWAYLQPQEGYSYDENENRADIEKWIGVAERALTSTSLSDASRLKLLFSSTVWLRKRYDRTNDTEDLAKSILRIKEAVSFFDLQAKPCPPWLLTYFADSLLENYKRTGRVVDLEDAREHINTAIALFQDDGNTSWHVFAYHVLGQVVLARSKSSQSIPELETTLRLFEDLEMRSFQEMGGYTQSLFFSCFGTLHEAMYGATRRVEHLELAIEKTDCGLAIVSETDSFRGNMLRQRARLLNEKHLVNVDVRNAVSGFEAMWDSIQSPHQSPLQRIGSAVWAVHLLCAHQDCEEMAARIVSYVLPLIPYTCGRDLKRQDQVHTARQVSAIAGLAIFVFLRIDKVETALGSLELTRGLIINSLLDDQSDVSNLQRAHPGLAQSYSTLRLQALQSADCDTAVNDQGQNKRRAAFQQLNSCEDQIRQEAGFENFQQQVSFETLSQISEEGPIVVVNSIRWGSDAILVTKSGTHTFPLPGMTQRAPLEFKERLSRSEPIDPAAPRDLESDEQPVHQSTELLSWLWTTCVEPILRFLISKGALSTSDKLSRVWWIGTGSASVLPFHAAGDYMNGILVPGQSCLDKVISVWQYGVGLWEFAPTLLSQYNSLISNCMVSTISSYTPTIKVLANARARAAQGACIQNSNNAEDSLLLVTMPTTPGHSDLLGVRRESQAIIKTTARYLTVEEMEQPSADEVLRRLRDHSGIVHFACHGYSDPSDPSLSHLLLQKHGEQNLVVDKLSVTNLLDTRFEGQGQIAYLSACSTATIKDAALADESLHITSGFLIAGFAHVIGSLWSADDDVCVRITTHFYTSLFTKRATHTYFNRAVAQAVHDAQRQIRREYIYDPSMWALYVHVGA